MRATLPLLVLAACAPPDVDATPADGTSDLLADAELGEFLADRMRAARVPGLSAALVSDGEVVAVGAWGIANVAEDRPVTPDTLFNVASVSKTVVATAAMRAVEEGQVDLDADVNDVLPFAVDHPEGGAVTLRALLTHSAGIRDNWGVLDSLYVKGDSSIALGDFLRDYLVDGGDYHDERRNFGDAPGVSVDYSNVGTSLAAYVVEVATGTPFDAYTTSRVFEPLGMDDASWRLAGVDVSRLAMPYGWVAGDWEPYGHYGYPDYPDGNLRVTAPQLARLLAAYSTDGAYDGVRILEASSVREVLSPQVPDLDDTQGLVWYSWELGGETVWGHNGGDDGIASEILFRPSDGAGVVVLMNGDGDRWGPVEEIQEALLARLE